MAHQQCNVKNIKYMFEIDSLLRLEFTNVCINMVCNVSHFTYLKRAI